MMFFFFKQKTAYEMRISDWSSDVCSSDLTKMTQEDAFEAAEGLKLKFGPPTFMDKTRVTIVRPRRDQSLVYNRPVWDSADGTQQMKVNPAQYTASRAQFTYAAVVLFDKRMNEVWFARRDRKSTRLNSSH